MNNSTLFKQAHAMTKQVIKQGDNYNVTFGLCLKAVKAKQANQQLVKNNVVMLFVIVFVMFIDKVTKVVKTVFKAENIAGIFVVLPIVFMFAYLLIAIIAYRPIY